MKNSSDQTVSTDRTARSLVVDNSAIYADMTQAAVFPELRTYRLHAPTLIDYEFLHAARRGARIPELGPTRAREAIESFLQLHITRHPAGPLLRAMWSFRHDVSAYDASYLALAQALGVPLLTCDKRLAKTARRWCDVILPD